MPDGRQDRPEKRRCPAHNRRGEPCRKAPRIGATHCQNHGGPRELLPPGDPGRGGAPPKTFMYSRFLRTQEDRDLYESARTVLGKLDEEIALARTNLARYQRAVEDSAKGGIPISVADGGKSVSVRPYANVVQEYLDLIGKLEERRSRILAQEKPPDAGDIGPLRWSFERTDEVGLDDPGNGACDPGGDDADARE